jgi:hypothetical protein
LTDDGDPVNLNFETAYELSAWAWRGIPADIMNQRMLGGWNDLTFRPLETVETEFATGMGSGGKLFIGDILDPVKAPPNLESMKFLAECFSFSKQRESAHAGTTRVSDIAILSSPEALRSARGKWKVNEDPIRGAYLAVIEAGLTADVLFDADLERHLRTYRALIIPEQYFVGRSAAKAIKEFVSRGGGLVLTGCLPRTVDPDEPDRSASEELFGEIAGLAGAGPFDFNISYLRLRDTPALSFRREQDGFRPDIPVHGRPARVRSTGAEVLSKVVAPGVTYQLGTQPPGETTDAPALAINTYGKGRVAFSALPLASEIWLRNNPWATYVLEAMLRKTAIAFRVELREPSPVQIFHSSSETRSVIDLVSFQGNRGNSSIRFVESASLLSGVEVLLADTREPRSVLAEPSGESLKWLRTGGWLLVKAPPFAINVSLVFSWL